MESPLQTMLRQDIHPQVIEDIMKDYYSTALKKGGNATEPLFKFLDVEYYGEILIGHPGQKFNVVFDTLYSSCWVPSVLCPSFSIPCAIRRKYDGNMSSKSVNTFKRFNLNFGNSNLTGNIWQDLFHLGKINVTNQTFGAASEIPWLFIYSKADGVVGLAPNNKGFDNSLPFFRNMIKQNLLTKPTFSFYMNRDAGTIKGGSILFGGTDPYHYKGKFTYIKVDLNLGLWAIKMNKLIVNKTLTVCANGCTAIIDTSTNVIQGPAKEIDAINEYIKAESFYFGRNMVDCASLAKLPSITLSFQGRDFVLKPREYIQMLNWGPVTICLSTFKKPEIPDNNYWFLGGAFTSKYYVTFDLGNYKIGFADAL